MAVLLERQAQLARLQALLDDAVAGHGRLVFVGGQAGVGKSSLLAELLFASAGRVRVRRGTADSLTTPAALGPWLEAVPELSEVGVAPTPTRQEIYSRLRRVLGAEPALVVLEDMHWADEASLETLRMLGRRVDGLPVLVVATYRSEEAGRRQPVSLLLGQLATAAGVERMALDPLSVEAVALLVEAAGAAVDAVELHRTTGGNPFYVTEVLAAGGPDLPAAVRDAVRGPQRPALVRRPAGAGRGGRDRPTGRGGPADDRVRAGGVRGRRVRRSAGVLVADGPGWAFRHEIARVAVEQSLPPGVSWSSSTPRPSPRCQESGVPDDRRLAHHAAASGQHAVAAEHAAAGGRAGRPARGAPARPAEQYRLALRMPGAYDPEERRRLFGLLSYECYLTDELGRSPGRATPVDGAGRAGR